jgi:hypothetical protein
MLGIFLDSVSRVPLFALRSQARPEAVAKVDLIQLFPYLALLYVALVHGGLVGAAWAYCARVFVNYFLLSYEAGSMQRTGGQALLAAVVLLGAWYSASTYQPWSAEWLGGLGVSLVTAFGLASWLLPADLRQALAGRLRAYWLA